jgi:hypothetical protein
VRQAADYGEAEGSTKIAQRQVQRAAAFLQTVQEVIAEETDLFILCAIVAPET